MSVIERWSICDVVMIAIRRRTEEAKIKLEVEESGRIIAQTQGLVRGLRILEKKLHEEYGGFYYRLLWDSTAARSEIDIKELSNGALVHLEKSIADYSYRYENIKDELDHIRASDAQYLYEDAEKARDLDLLHGKRDGMAVYEEYVKKIEDRLEFRREQESLFVVGDEDGEDEFFGPSESDVTGEENDEVREADEAIEVSE